MTSKLVRLPEIRIEEDLLPLSTVYFAGSTLTVGFVQNKQDCRRYPYLRLMVRDLISIKWQMNGRRGKLMMQLFHANTEDTFVSDVEKKTFHLSTEAF
jgi:hypothetical protein